ncbi:FMN-binding protein [Sinomonas sp. JGH33]|uniref:FMN-binding protein n=1 Tax=Sinomonas terricola TaxID=3110330 RepID=A0ABU5T995_9MICC|nr:FMN-binding protein [Sinomonas sp. JGH33]MEA5455676.1 FMN-binding protein [Sinomonas sp. JGH33]
MRARAAAAAALASAGILAAGWQAGARVVEAASVTTGTSGTALGNSGASGAAGGSGTSGGSGAGTSGAGSTSGSAGSASGSQGSSSSGSLKNGTFTGAAEETRFGEVQVQIVVAGGKITDVKALHLTDAERRSQMISAYAAPTLRSEVLQAQSANVDTVSGATVTSDAYLSSLQAALDAARA